MSWKKHFYLRKMERTIGNSAHTTKWAKCPEDIYF